MQPLIRILGSSGVLCLMSVLSIAETYHVSTSGADSDSGTQSQPWRTLGKAAGSVVAGDVILVGGGVYNEVLSPTRSGTEGQWIEFSAKPGETPVIDGEGLQLNSSRKGLVFFSNTVAYVRVRGFEIRNTDNRTSTSRDPIGIAFRNNVHDIEIIDCQVHDISTHLEDKTPKGISIEGMARSITIQGGSVADVRTTHADGNAHAIAVYGEETVPIDQVVIENVVMSGFTLGTSETLVFNGNVTRFQAIGNTLYDSNNIGIDVIGFEGVGPAGLDQARDGVIAGNTIYNISTRNNPAYDDYTAAGIYVDGGRDLVIDRNRVYNCDIGIELASEDSAGITSGVIVRNNVVWHNSIGGLLLGGYDRRRGATEGCMIVNNTFFENDTRRFQIGEVNIRYSTNNNTFQNNLFVAGEQGYLVTFPEEFADSSGNSFDNNGYYTSGRTTGWEWQGRWASSWSSFKQISGQEASGVFADPKFTGGVDEIAGLSLTAGSPMIDAGFEQADADSRTDVAGNPRLAGLAIDIGAFEYGSVTQSALRFATLDIDAVTGERLITLLPRDVSPAVARVEFSSDGQNWSTIASLAENDDGWTTGDGVQVEALALSVQLRDTRSIEAGFYRAVQ
ncbi:MAG: hypothetical protein ACI9R3_003470 [Verrucomicrobiales bacterium]|jgi:hypothetical protein